MKVYLRGTPGSNAKAFLKTGDDDDVEDNDPWMFHNMIGIWVFQKEDGTMHEDLVVQ